MPLPGLGFDVQAAQRAVERVQADKEGFELVYTSTPTWPLAVRSEAGPSNIAILDSSFNPPHFAHLAIASSALPPPLPSQSSINLDEGSRQPPQLIQPATDGDDAPPYSARLLVFSVRNIEKTPKEGDATVMQRLEMTVLLAEALASALDDADGEMGTQGEKDGKRRRIPVAVGILNEPTFVGKSRIIHRFLRERQGRDLSGDSEPTPAPWGEPAMQPTSTESVSTLPSRPTLTFLIGTDTLTRFFEPKFYPQGMDVALLSFFAGRANRDSHDLNSEEDGGEGGDGSILVSARRGTSFDNRALERNVLEGAVATKWASAGRVRLLGDGSEGWEEISSTRIRKAVEQGDWVEVRRLVPQSIEEYVRREGLYRRDE